MTPALEFDAFAQRLLQLLEQGRIVATYKYAVLLALLDVLVENSNANGAAPAAVKTRDLADAVLEIYWPHTRPFADHDQLRQNRAGQAEIVSLISTFRVSTVGDASSPLSTARWKAPEAYQRLARLVEWKLIEMPIGKLQLVGDQYDPFLYELGWSTPPTRAAVTSGQFTGELELAAGAGDHLLRAAPFLRPLVQSVWVTAVSRFNAMQEAELARFLFGAQRISLAPVTGALRELAKGRCFYCTRQVTAGGQIDHFVPWARHVDNGLLNLVYTHGACNNAKSSSLAAQVHVERWLIRASAEQEALADLGSSLRWDCSAPKTIAAARSIYLGLPANYKLWRAGKEFDNVDLATMRTLFAAT